MSFTPVLHPVVLVLAGGGLLFFTIRHAITAPRDRLVWVLRSVLVLACVAVLLRPGIPGGTSTALATDVDVFFVVDTTSSSVAEDWGSDEARLVGIREDVASIVSEYPGARFSLITFDAAAELRVPLTTDTTALISAMSVLRPEVTSRSRGSSVGIAAGMLADTLESSRQISPERARMVFYLGDGEQTSRSPVESFRSSAQYVDGGAVLGYGTAEGGRMLITSGRVGEPDTDYIQYQGEDARSIIDEANLRAIAADLTIPYERRSVDVPLTLPTAPTSSQAAAVEDGEVGNTTELYWIPAILIGLLMTFDVLRTALHTARMRGLVATGPRR